MNLKNSTCAFYITYGYVVFPVCLGLLGLPGPVGLTWVCWACLGLLGLLEVVGLAWVCWACLGSVGLAWVCGACLRWLGFSLLGCDGSAACWHGKTPG